MILLDEVGVEQADSVILATATSDCVFLGGAQPRQGFAGIEQTAVGVRQFGHVAGGECGNTRKGLHEVQCVALAGQQDAGRAVQAKQLLIGRELFAILHFPLHLDLTAELGEHFIHPGLATEDARLPGDDPGTGNAIRRDQLGRDIGAGIRLIERGEGLT